MERIKGGHKLIDEEWLSRLHFITDSGVEITGLAGTGADAVVLKGVITVGASKGKRVALKTYRHHLGYHIRELPPFLISNATYDMQRLNAKLSTLVGIPGVDEMVESWDRLFSMLTKTIYEKGFESLSMIPLAHAYWLTDSLPLLAYSSPVRRRLVEFCSMGEDENPFVRVNGPNFSIDGFRGQVKDRATELLATLDRKNATPETFHNFEDNPLFIWGGAAMEGFFDSDSELSAAGYMSALYGSFPSSSRAARLLDEADALANVYAYFFVEEEDRDAIVKFTSMCARTGLIFDVVGRDGDPVANGWSLLLGGSAS